MTPTFRQQLKLARGPRTQRESAAQIGCSLRTFEEWESGRRVPKSWTREHILALLSKKP